MSRAWVGVPPAAVRPYVRAVIDSLPRRRPGADLHTARLPVVGQQHATGPAPLFDPDRAARVDPAPMGTAAAVELAGGELADQLPAPAPPASAWFEPVLPGARPPMGPASTPPPAVLRAAAETLRDAGRRDVARFLDEWAGVR